MFPDVETIILSDQRWRLPMKNMFLTAFAVVTLGIGAANAQSEGHPSAGYHAPAHNFYQNNWMSGAD
ncbi:MAG: hypothetical protein QOD93_6559 [Acetobacteraceae bacterium]|nr:hypothetical protein [Acetobacteraceae bacterium]